MTVRELGGIVPILPTPMTEEGDLDEEGMRHVVRHAIASEADGVVVLGSNGEFPYLSDEERRRVTAAAVDAADGAAPVIGSASATSTRHAVELARAAREVGCEAVMATVHAYWRMEPGTAREHVAAIAEELPVFFYYFPEVSGLVLTVDEIAAIAALDGVVGAKVTVANAPFLRKLIEATRPHGWRVFTGTTFLLRECLEAGGAGVFCPLPLVAPALVRDYHRAVSAGDPERAGALRRRVLRGPAPLQRARAPGPSPGPRLLAAGGRAVPRAREAARADPRSAEGGAAPAGAPDHLRGAGSPPGGRRRAARAGAPDPGRPGPRLTGR